MRRRLHGHTKGGREISDSRHRQVTGPAATHIGGVGAGHPVAVGQQLRGVHRTADDDRTARRQPTRGRSAAPSRRDRRPRRSESARAQRLRRRPASARPNAARRARMGAAPASAASAADCVHVGAVGRSQVRSQQQGLGDQRRTRRRRPVERVGGPNHQLPQRHRRCRTSGRHCLGSAKWSSAMSSNKVAELSQDASPVSWYSVSSPVASARVVLEDRRAVTDDAAQAGPPQPAVDDMQIRRCVCAHRVAASSKFGFIECHAGFGERGDRQPVPCGDDLVVAAGLGTDGPGRQQRRYAPARSAPDRQGRSAVAAPNCRVRRCRRR